MLMYLKGFRMSTASSQSDVHVLLIGQVTIIDAAVNLSRVFIAASWGNGKVLQVGKVRALAIGKVDLEQGQGSSIAYPLKRGQPNWVSQSC